MKRKDFGRESDRSVPRRKDAGPPQRPATASLYGVLPVLEALRSGGRRIEKILVADGVRQHRLNEIFALAREHRVILETVPRERLDRLVEDGANHQGVAAIAASADYFDADEIVDHAGDAALFV